MKKLNKKGFAVSIIVYSIITLAVLLFFLILMIQRNTRSITVMMVQAIKNELNDTIELGDVTSKKCFVYDKDSATITDYKCYDGNPYGLPTVTDVVIPSRINRRAVLTIGSNAFKNKGLTKVTFTEGIKAISPRAFNTNNITEIVFSSSITTIGNYAFANNQINNLNIPTTVTVIDYAAFNNNKLPDDQAFIYKRKTDGTSDWTHLVSYGGAKRDNVIIPSGIQTLGMRSMSECSLTSVVMPNTLKKIGTFAVRSNLLTSISIPTSVTSIAQAAFNNNRITTNNGFVYARNSDGSENRTIIVSYGSNNKNPVIPTGVKVIEVNAFLTSYISTVQIPSTVTTIKAAAFFCNSLVDLNIPSSVNFIGRNAFNNNYLPDEKAFIYARKSDGSEDRTTLVSYAGSNRTDVVIPSNVTTIGEMTFYQNAIRAITIPSTVTSIGQQAFGNNKLTTITIPSSITVIPKNLVRNNVLTTINFPTGVTEIKEGAFAVNNLVNITIPSTVTSIEVDAFKNNKITAVSIPSSVINLANGAFDKRVNIVLE